MTGLTSTTFEVRFSHYDTNIFVTETDVATDTYKLKFDLDSYTANGIKTNIDLSVQRVLYINNELKEEYY